MAIPSKNLVEIINRIKNVDDVYVTLVKEMQGLTNQTKEGNLYTPDSPYLPAGLNTASLETIRETIDSVLPNVGNQPSNIPDLTENHYSPTDPPYNQTVTPVSQLGNYPSYWASIVPETKKVVTNLLDIANSSLDSFIGAEGGALNNLIKNTTGLDPLQQYKAQIMGKLATPLGVNSDDAYFGAKYGLNIGQDTGNFFTPTVAGFRDSQQNTSEPQDEYADWYLPYTDPSIYNLDQRMRYGRYTTPDSKNFLSVLQTLQNASDPNGIPIISGLINTVGGYVNDVTTLVDKAGNVFSTIGKFVTGNSGPLNHFLNRFVDAPIAVKNETNIWNTAADVILSGNAGIDQNGPMVAVEATRNYINTNPMGYASKPFVYDAEKIFEDESEYISNLTLDRFLTAALPNIKTNQENTIITAKQNAQDTDKLIYERFQQFNGAYDGVTYNQLDSTQQATSILGPTNASSFIGPLVQQGFDPNSTAPDLDNTKVLNHVSSARIDDLLGITKGTPTNYDIPPELMAHKELQYFPLWIRTINRDDMQVIQQPYYDSGAVFLSKRRIAGSSIIFFDAALDPISEMLSSTWNATNYTGRTDPVYTYTNTLRSTSFGFTVMASTPQDVPNQIEQIEALRQMMYPELMAINEVGSVGFRRGPICEMRVGDWFYEVVILTQVSITELDNAQWDILPGGRVPRGWKIQLSLNIIHREQPHSAHNFISPTFKRQVFYPLQNGAFLPS